MEPFARIPGRHQDAAFLAAIDKAIGKRRRSTRSANLGIFTGYRIGLDVGNGNIGWCVLFEDGPRLYFLTAEEIATHNAALPKGKTRTQLPDLDSFVPLGTHKFEARENSQKGEKSFSKIKAESRARVGLLDARQNRKLHVRECLEAAGLLPPVGTRPEGHANISADRLRAKLLEPGFAPTHPHDLGRALFNVLKRRGWMKPIGRAGVDEESDFGDKATQIYRETMARFGCATIGQFLERCAIDAKRDKELFKKRHRSLAWQQRIAVWRFRRA